MEGNIRLDITIELEVSDNLKKRILNNEEELANFIISNCFRNNARTLIKERITKVKEEKNDNRRKK